MSNRHTALRNHAILFPVTPETLDISPTAAPRFNPREIEDLENTIAGTIRLIEENQQRLIDTLKRRARRMPVSPSADHIRRQIETYNERLDLLLSEYEYRNM